MLKYKKLVVVIQTSCEVEIQKSVSCEIEITDPDVIATSGKCFHPMLIKTDKPTDTVAGVIFELTEDELAQADSYEVDAYNCVQGQFESGKTAWMYADANISINP